MPASTALSNSINVEMEFHPTIQIYDTLTKKKQPFGTVEPGKVGIYLCGPTVYDRAHIGHMIGPVIFDCIKRYLTYCNFAVTWVVNITDVDDKLIKKATERGISMLEVADENIVDYQQNLAALGVDQIDHFPRATECMADIIAFIESLVNQGYAYESKGDVYFDVGKDTGYGKLSNRSVDSMQGEGGDTATLKRQPADFAVWKSAKPGEPSWNSSWGAGRPGWHIECSAMSKKLLGETFDIHGGGLDLVFPHHENEIAQSECCHSKPMVRYWLHNGLLRQTSSSGKIGGRGEREGAPTEDQAGGKMSRSQGAGGLAELITRQGGERIRFFLLRTHYRSTVLFDEPAIEEAGIGLETFYRLFKRYERITGKDFYALDAPRYREKPPMTDVGHATLQSAHQCRERFLKAMDDDFNTGGAIAELFELAKLINKFCDAENLETAGDEDPDAVSELPQLMIVLKELSCVLGLFSSPPAAMSESSDDLLHQVMELVIELRTAARQNKDFTTADTIRDGVAAAGLALEDRPDGTEWTGGRADTLDPMVQLLIQIRNDARKKKDFSTADTVRDRLGEIGVTLEDRSGGTEWSPS
ncbi:MAG: cysteine--tRNA ligase [Pirellulales bacterium]|nr:cysteine--tRNA ligase [Pirellulales bacterium]